MMRRQYIVPDCIGFYLLSLYPMPLDKPLSQEERHLHMGRIKWVVNRAMGTDIFRTKYEKAVDQYMKRNRKMSIEQLLSSTQYSDFL